MPAEQTYDYAIIRVVPRVERGELVNVGVILSCPGSDFLEARIDLDETRLLALDPAIDLEATRANLEMIPRVCRGGADAGPIGDLPQRGRFHWLVSPRARSSRCRRCTRADRDPAKTLEHLLDTMAASRRAAVAPELWCRAYTAHTAGADLSSDFVTPRRHGWGQTAGTIALASHNALLSLAMPMVDRGRLEKHQRFAPPRPQPLQQQPEQTIRRATATIRPSEDAQLVAQGKTFEQEASPRRQGQPDGGDRSEDVAHRA